MQSKIANTFLAFGLGTALLVAGCGGGGGGGGTTASVAYSGVTAQAVISDENAEALLTAAMEVEVGDLDIIIVAGATAEETSQTGLSLPRLAVLLAKTLDLAKTTTPPIAAGATETIAGDCGGTATISATSSGDETNFTANGTITYSNYCVNDFEGDVVINGSVTFSMSGSETSFTYTLSASNLTIATGGQSVTYNLTYTIAFEDGAMTATMSADYQAADGTVYRVEDYRFVFNEYDDSLTVSGKVYHPDHGYVEITTLQPLQHSFCPAQDDYLPTAGVVRLDGADGTWAEFHAVDCVQYQVCVNDTCELDNW